MFQLLAIGVEDIDRFLLRGENPIVFQPGAAASEGVPKQWRILRYAAVCFSKDLYALVRQTWVAARCKRGVYAK
jgi:hypothetical protein